MQSTYYILKDKQVVPCQDIEVWQRFMNSTERIVGSETAGKFGVHTAFVGVNLGSEFMPKFFRTTISGDDGQNDPWLAETWDEAAAKHRALIRSSISLTELDERMAAGEVSGARVVDYSILPDDELRFVLVSEAAAIKLVPDSLENWTREGRVITFHPRRNKKTVTEVTDGDL
ncbi:hypothetical protein S7335_1123 [Synechococcus sp. PCC 7335]|uniref:hypothetical protein n=1 Tax=Synechococcus sp. (strain ATCC 29403 / PCC 7335) TaxID=91464 RepID=UPI00017EC827|nr:hypothetical protein [Synechococcus sp. PCC 7335]EDX82820.1 hypothetical protein S7335_1123 [Synechococcus sp. PCC 7335]